MPATTKKIYIKDYSYHPFHKSKNLNFFARTRILPIFLLISGTLVLGSQVVLPLIYFKTNTETTNPKNTGTVLGVATGFSEFKFSELPTKQTQIEQQEETPEYFYLTIPKLGIINATVETNAESLNPDKTLGHYKGSGLPGETGTAFIYGHSVLPFFYNPKNYKTIFSTLDKLQVGDEFYIKYKNEDLTYKVENRVILKPEQVNPLAQLKPAYLNESTITLMTCVPPGTREKRLLVNAVLVN